jgi:hypothetical protein
MLLTGLLAGLINAGRYLRRVTPRGTLAIIRGIPGSQVDTDRVDGVKAGVKGSGIRVVREVAANFDRQQRSAHGRTSSRRTPRSSQCSAPTTRWRAVNHERVRRNVNTGNPLVTQHNAAAYFKRVQSKLDA